MIRQLAKIEPWDPAARFLDLTRRATFKTIGSKDTKATLDAWIQMVEDESRTTKQSGDLFEELCVYYFLYCKNMAKVWTLTNVPVEVRTLLGLHRADYGIDVIAKDQKGGYHAIQAKFRGRRNKGRNRYNRRITVSWKSLTTFIALANRTGPYTLHWVFTCADGVSNRGGKRDKKDRSVCYRTLCSLPKEFWLKTAQMHGQKLNNVEVENKPGDPKLSPGDPKLSLEELREKRLTRLFPKPAQKNVETKDIVIEDDDPLWEELGID